MIVSESRVAGGYSAVELGAARHVLATAVPHEAADLHAGARDALRTLGAIMEDAGCRGSVVAQTVFLRDARHTEDCRQIVNDFYGAQLPATVYVAQPPCGGGLLQIEALGIGGGGGVAVERYPDQAVVCRHGGATWIHLAGISATTGAAGVHDGSLEVFGEAARRLAARGSCYENVVRTWLYLGDIVGREAETTRYQELNRARSGFYRDLRFGAGLTPAGWSRPVYPASTGIGTLGGDVTMGCIALAGHAGDLVLLPLENPKQTSAFDYGHQFGPQSPKFARAMAVLAADMATIFISGTASITRSETRSVGDVEGQTRQTWENITALIGQENFRRHGIPGAGATLEDLALVRVYVKRQEDYETVKAVCEARLGQVPTVYAVADVCRAELLVEIEAIAFSSLAT
jgi:enamine deaminase RidA (YjgF/YER057c/UK114 family)